MKAINKLSGRVLFNTLAAGMLLSSASTFAQIEEIVVTAQFIEQNVQDTPVAITSMTAEMMEARGQVSVTEIAKQAPNVTLTEGGAYAGPALIAFIRGVGQTDFDPALEPGVGLYVDDLYYSTLTGSILDLLDLERVEVLRGPQGTLAGKNSIGGAIKLYTQKPSDESNGYLEASYGDYDEVAVRGASNFTLIDDKLYARLAGVSRSRDGYVKRLDYACTHPGATLGLPSQVQGADCVLGTEGGIKYTAARLALRWLLSDSVEVNFSSDVLDDTSEAAPNVILNTGATTAPVIDGVGIYWDHPAIPPVLPESVDVGCLFIAYGPNSCDPNSPRDPYVNYATYVDSRNGTFIKNERTVDSRGHTLNIDWQINDDLQLQSITGYRTYESSFGNDADGTPVPVQQLYQTMEHTQRSQEFRLNGSVGTVVDYTAGLFYFDADTAHIGRINLGYVGFDFIHGPDPVDSTTQAVFAHAIWHPTDFLNVSVGWRHTKDEKDYTYARHNPDFTDIQDCVDLVNLGNPLNPPNCLISTLNGVSSTFEDTRDDYRLAVSYSINEDMMVYAQYSTGFKGGGVNPRPFYNAQAVSFDPETLNALEFGFKSELLNNSLRLNAAVFLNEYKDIQLTFTDCTGLFGSMFGRPCLLNSNAGDADVNGVEVEIEWFPVDGLQVDAAWSTLDFEYSRVDPNVAVSPDNITPFTPENKGSLGIQYAVVMGDNGSLIPRLDWSFQDDIFIDPENTPGGLIDSYDLLNVGVTWRSPDEDWQATLKINNASDKLYYTNLTNAVPTGGGTAYAVPGMPRTWLFTVKHSF